MRPARRSEPRPSRGPPAAPDTSNVVSGRREVLRVSQGFSGNRAARLPVRRLALSELRVERWGRGSFLYPAAWEHLEDAEAHGGEPGPPRRAPLEAEMNGVGTRARRKQREIPASTALVLFALGCSHSSPPPTTASGAGEADARERSSREGEVAMEFLPDPAASEIKVAENQEFAPPAPMFTPLPVYPPAALEGGASSTVVAVRLHLDATGAVIQVTDSPRRAPHHGPYASDFRKAVESAVRRWVFTAARIDTVDAAPPWNAEPGSKPPLVSTRYVPSFLDFSFRFTVVDGRGVVEMGPRAPAPQK